MSYSPERGSSRIVIATWFLFSIMMYATYTGNLVAFLTSPKIKLPVETMDDIPGSGYKLGGLHNGAFHHILKHGEDSLLQELWALVSDNENYYMPTSSPEIIELVLKDKYYMAMVEQAFFDNMEGRGDDIGRRKCDLARMKPTYLPSINALPFQKGSPFVDTFSKQ